MSLSERQGGDFTSVVKSQDVEVSSPHRLSEERHHVMSWGRGGMHPRTPQHGQVHSAQGPSWVPEPA